MGAHCSPAPPKIKHWKEKEEVGTKEATASYWFLYSYPTFTDPEVPQGVGLTLSDPDTSSVLVEYDAPSSGMHDGYLITYSGVSVGADGNEPSPITAEASSTQRTITGLTPGTVYTVTVQSIVNDGNTVSSTTTRSISTGDFLNIYLKLNSLFNRSDFFFFHCL